MPPPDFDRMRKVFQDEVRHFTDEELIVAGNRGIWYDGRNLSNWRLEVLREEIMARKGHTGYRMLPAHVEKPLSWNMMQAEREKVRLAGLTLGADGKPNEPPAQAALSARERVRAQFIPAKSAWDWLKNPGV